MTNRKKTASNPKFPSFFRAISSGFQCGKGIWALLATLVCLSLLAGANFQAEKRLYVAGQIADSNVVAERDFRIEDIQATKARKKQVQALQPPVYDLSMEPFSQFQARIVEILRNLNSGGNQITDPLLQRSFEEMGQTNVDELLKELAKPEVQNYILKKLLPVIRNQLSEGLIGDIRASRIGRSGYILRNLDTNSETLISGATSLPDVQSFLAEISAQLRHAQELQPEARRAINALLSIMMPSSLTLNREATQQRAADNVATVTPVYYQIEKGELLLRKGERVSREQQIKLQALYNSAADPVKWSTVCGALLISLLFSTGFFLSPSGKPGRPLHSKDMYLLSVILMIFGAGAKGVYIFGLHMDSLSLLNSFATAFPVAGAVGLVAMVFAARRYCTMGLLLSFFCMLMFEKDYGLFLFYFLGGMLATWLVTQAQTRQDVVWDVIPLFAGLIIIWAGCAALWQIPGFEVPMQLVAVAINSLLSLIILFAFSPVLEMLFGYSTRFRLMELMSLEHPLMQEIMVTIPGTYHHSLVVATMVEAGAKAIGANSLLCKVAALYHDAGKLSYPEYFIENQFGAPNKHDKLTPSLSALILLSHVKKGAELAGQYKLGQEIADIIQQHHGTRLMRFFYQKALDMGEKAQEANYAYPGPRPQSKEAAILMLADSVEASSRTLTDPTPARIKNHIDNIIKGIFAEGQLDEAELTFKDLHKLSENFQRILLGIFHQRIVYPETKIKTKMEAQIIGQKAEKPETAEKQDKTQENAKNEKKPEFKPEQNQHQNLNQKSGQNLGQE